MADEGINITKLRKQFNYLNKLNRLKHRELVRYHDKVFRGTRWFIQVPRLAHKEFIIRRLWFHYCWKHYHYPRGHPATQAFAKRAKTELSRPYDEQTDSVFEMSRTMAMDHRAFSKQAVKDMPINQVDRQLAMVGIFADIKEPWRRQLLWEFYNRPAKQKGDVREVDHGRVNNRWFLTDVILAHPSMSFDEFRSVYGNQMPAVTRSSFNNCRSRLRKAGYQIPELRRGPYNPAMVRDGNTMTRGR